MLAGIRLILAEVPLLSRNAKGLWGKSGLRRYAMTSQIFFHFFEIFIDDASSYLKHLVHPFTCICCRISALWNYQNVKRVLGADKL